MPETPPPIIRLRGLRKSYGNVQVLRGVDLDVPHGQTVSVIGPSGSGKSTLLRLLMLLDAPDAGELEIDGESPWTAEPGGRMRADNARLRRVRGKVGMVFQHFNLFPHMNALQNVMEAPVSVLGLKAGEARERALDYLDQVGLADKAEAMPAQLSGGQKQRVAIARALALQPRIMLFDEVTSALDPELVGGVLALLRGLAQRRTITMLIVTHHMRFAERCADRVLFFENGVIAEDGPPAELFHDGVHERTRRFVEAVTGD
ncbi:MAG: amino acid ABC transporter ATP-binding protein [Betaproteobacteria bacterium]|jgi:polar amino acid transport system ATP-binding protein|nr:amino acid ABC transporter ATP-binding protein [Betaproteobacteria bacterium]MDH4293412.1 amino acid ABC transporter ATP-binding protein [Betaproteobacteria bacterium]MDH5343858.1 amino acid ABC transporter ATP-binding protein [Betaproteobacteria bacterium]